MEFRFNAVGAQRKALVQVVGELTEQEPVYKGAPSFAYAVDNYLIDKGGTLICPDGDEKIAEVLESLKERGFIAEEDDTPMPDEEPAAAEEEPASEMPEEVAVPESPAEDAVPLPVQGPAVTEAHAAVRDDENGCLTIEVNMSLSPDEAPRKLRGRGGSNNFGNNKSELVKTEEDRQLVQGLLSEVLEVYRMPRVTSDDELAKRIGDYFSVCAQRGQIPTVEEMAMCTGYSQSTLWDWETGRRKGFTTMTAELIKKAKEFLKTFDAKLVISGKLNFLVYCFRSKNYYGMVDKVEHVVTPGDPLGELKSAEEVARRYIEGIPRGDAGE